MTPFLFGAILGAGTWPLGAFANCYLTPYYGLILGFAYGVASLTIIFSVYQ